MREHVAAEGVTVHPDGVSLDVKDGAITARLLVDCMGNFGPIVRQVHRLLQKTKRNKNPETMCGVFPRPVVRQVHRLPQDSDAGLMQPACSLVLYRCVMERGVMR